MLRLIARLLDIRFLYVMWAPLFWDHAKPGITNNLTRRQRDINDSILGPVWRIVPPLPFVFATAWEHVILYSTLPFKHAPMGAGPKSGINEWRRFPILPVMPIFLALYVVALWLLQVHLLLWGLTYFTAEEPFSLFEYLSPYFREAFRQAEGMMQRWL